MSDFTEMKKRSSRTGLFNNGQLPDFAIIGAQKAGTTSVLDVLSKHSAICASNVPETTFFTNDSEYARGSDYYARFYTHREPGQLCGEATPDYLHKPGVAARLYAANPRAKLIAILRNPLDRAFSAYLMQLSKGSEHPSTSFETALQRQHATYVSFGNYYDQLKEYFGVFDRAQILVLLFEDLRANPAGFYHRLCHFLEIDEKELNLHLATHSNPGGMPRYEAVALALNLAFRTRNALRRTPLAVLVNNKIIDRTSRTIRNRIATLNRSTEDYPRLTPEQRHSLASLWRDKNRQLAQLIDLDISIWNE